MKPRANLLLVILLNFVTCTLIAQTIDIQTAQTIAEHRLSSFRKQSLKTSITSKSRIRFTSAKAVVENRDTLYYVLNDTISKSFVIVSADKRAWPVLGFSTEGSLDENNLPEALTDWLDNRKEEIRYIKDNNIQADSKTIEAWTNLEQETTATTQVGPLLKTKWGQNCYYNELCPEDSEGPCGHAVAGCVATAMAQIMKYWNYPTRGKGSYSYVHSTYGTISADFDSTIYQWDQMPDRVGGTNNAVATLMYQCGVAVHMGYGPDGSSTSCTPDAFINYFDYSSGAKSLFAGNYTSLEWSNLLRQELDAGRPVYYTVKVSDDGHAVVCDGYTDNDYFHFNWGWDGDGNGYFYVNNSRFNGSNQIIVGIEPNSSHKEESGLFISANEINLVKNTEEVTIVSSADWTAVSDQSWLSLSVSKGSAGTSTLHLTAPVNDTNDDRTATVTITAAGFPSREIKVTQSRSYTYEITAGGLQQTIGNNSTAITSLVVKGTIDARDFKTMRDDMPLLALVDLSEATIAAYSGTEGTSIYGNTTYNANTVPESAFENSDQKGKTTLVSIQLPVTATAIGYDAFYGCSNLSSVDIPELITTIGRSAFYDCGSLITVTIPSSVSNIGGLVFYGCNQLTTIAVDSGNPDYSSSDGVLFNKIQTELIVCPPAKSGSYTIPSTVKSIGNNAFWECSDLTSIVFPDSLKTIESGAFTKCNGLNSLILPVSVVSIESSAFQECSGLTSVTVAWPVPLDLSNSPSVFSGTDGVNKDVCTLNVPYGTASLYAEADQWQDFLHIVEPDNGFTVGTATANIGQKEGSTVAVTLKANVNWSVSSDRNWLSVSPVSGTADATLTFTAEENAGNTTRTATVTVSAAGYDSQTVTVSQQGGAIELTAGTLSTTLTEAELNSTTYLKLTGTIDARDFKTMRDSMPLLSEVDLSGATIVAYAGTEGTNIWGARNYEANAIPSCAFYSGEGKTSLTSVLLPETTTAISGYAFCHCSDLTTMNITSSVDSISNYVFDYCERLATITVDENNPVFSSVDGVLFNKSQSGLIKCPEGKSGSYTIPSTVKNIGQNAFFRCDITSLTIPDSVQTIDEYAFNQCNWLKTLSLPVSVTSIGSYAFADCSNMNQITANWSVPLDISNSVSVFRGISKTECTLYVPYGTVALYAAADQWKDFVNITENDGFSIDAATVSVGSAEGSTATAGLKANVSWTATSDQNWLTVSPDSGTADATLTFTAAANTATTERTATVTVSAEGVSDQTITVTQEAVAATLSVSPSAVSVSKEEGSTATASVTSNTSWAVTADQSWLTVSPSGGTGDGTLTFTAAANTATTERTATVTISAEGVSDRIITVTQEAGTSTGIISLDDNTILMYPNPVSEGFTIKGIEKDATLTLLSASGQTLFSRNLAAGSTYIPVSGLPKGIYIVRICIGANCIDRKLVKE